MSSKEVRHKARNDRAKHRQVTRNSIQDNNRGTEGGKDIRDIQNPSLKDKKFHTVLPKSKLSLFVTPSQESLLTQDSNSDDFLGFSPIAPRMNTGNNEPRLSAEDVNAILFANENSGNNLLEGATALPPPNNNTGAIRKIYNKENVNKNKNKNVTQSDDLRLELDSMKESINNILSKLSQMSTSNNNTRNQNANNVNERNSSELQFNNLNSDFGNSNRMTQAYFPSSHYFNNQNQGPSNVSDRNSNYNSNNFFFQRQNREQAMFREVRLDKWNIKYDGNNMSAEDFIFQIEILREGSPYSWNEVYLNLSQVLTGSMTMFFLRYRKMYPNHGWMQFKESLSNLYGSLDTDITIYSKMAARKQGPLEPFNSFYADIMQLNMKMQNKKSNEELISIIKNNCIFRIGKELLNFPNASMSEIVNKCRQVEDFYKKNTLTAKKRFVHELEEFSSDNEDPTVEALQIKKNKYNDMSTIQCLECGAYGHKRVACPNKPRDVRQKYFCYRCGLEGYTFYTCIRCNSVPENFKRSSENLGIRNSTHNPGKMEN